MANARPDPYPAYNFLVEIDGVTLAGFSECSGLCCEIEVIEYREGGDISSGSRKLPGRLKHAPIVLKRGITDNRDLWRWFQNLRQGQLDRRNGVIVLLDEERQPVARWTFHRGWPAKWEGPHLRAKGNEVAIETLEIVHEGLDLE